MKCLLFNARSVKNKLDQLKFVQPQGCYDIIAITETWCNDSISDAMICDSKNYNLSRKDRQNVQKSTGGGLCILTRKSISIYLLHDFVCIHETCKILCLRCNANGLTFQLVLAYRPDYLSASQNDQFLDCIENFCSSSLHTIIVGDFNLPQIDWYNSKISSASKKSVESNFLVFCEKNNLHTRGNNILDLVLCNNENLIKNCDVSEPFSQSDHSSVYFEIFGFIPKQVDKSYLYNFRKGDYENLNIYLTHINWDLEFYGLNSVNVKYSRFCAIVQTAITYFVPKTSNSMVKKSSYLSFLNRQKRKLWKSSRKNPTDENVAKYKAASLKHNTQEGFKISSNSLQTSFVDIICMQTYGINNQKSHYVFFKQRKTFELHTTWFYAAEINSNAISSLHFSPAMGS